MCSKPQHNQISICPTQTVMGIWVMIWLCTLPSDKVHDLVLSLAWDVSVRQNHLHVGPARVVVQPIVDVVSKALSKTEHELSSLWIEESSYLMTTDQRQQCSWKESYWCDAVAVKVERFSLIRR